MPWGPTLIQSPVPPLFGHGAAGGGGGPGGGGGLIEVQCPPITVGDLTTDALFAFNQHLWFHIYQCHIINIARISQHDVSMHDVSMHNTGERKKEEKRKSDWKGKEGSNREPMQELITGGSVEMTTHLPLLKV